MKAFAANQGLKLNYSGDLKTKEQLWLVWTWDTLLQCSGGRPQRADVDPLRNLSIWELRQ
jgi:hypothetical protein